MSAEIARALRGALRFAIGDAGAAEEFENSAGAFFRSFAAAAFAAPFYFVAVLAQRRMEAEQLALDGLANTHLLEKPGAALLAFETGVYVLQWLVFPIAMLFLARLLLLQHRYFVYMTAYNWCAVVAVVLQMPPVWLYLLGAIPVETAGQLAWAALGITMAYRWFVTRTMLDTPAATAVALVLIDVLLGLFVAASADRLAQTLGLL